MREAMDHTIDGDPSRLRLCMEEEGRLLGEGQSIQKRALPLSCGAVHPARKSTARCALMTSMLRVERMTQRRSLSACIATSHTSSNPWGSSLRTCSAGKPEEGKPSRIGASPHRAGTGRLRERGEAS